MNLPNYSKELNSKGVKDFETAELFLEVEYNLKSLQDFFDELWKELIPGTAIFDYAFKKQRQCLAENPSPAVRVIDEVYYFTEAPNWHRKIFDNLKSFRGLSGEEQQGVRQFYDNLSTITTAYEKLRASRSGATIFPELVNKLKEIVTETIERGNPLKGTQPLATPDLQSGEVSFTAEAVKPFPCKAGTKWEDVKITLTANDTVRIETPQGKGRYTYHELGMADGRPGDKPKEVWETLKLFASNHGIFPQKNQKVNEKNLVEKAKHLNSHLKKLFEIEESIFKYHYRKYRRYETKIKFSDQTIAHVPDPSQDKSLFDSELDEINKKLGL